MVSAFVKTEELKCAGECAGECLPNSGSATLLLEIANKVKEITDFTAVSWRKNPLFNTSVFEVFESCIPESSTCEDWELVAGDRQITLVNHFCGATVWCSRYGTIKLGFLTMNGRGRSYSSDLEVFVEVQSAYLDKKCLARARESWLESLTKEDFAHRLIDCPNNLVPNSCFCDSCFYDSSSETFFAISNKGVLK